MVDTLDLQDEIGALGATNVEKPPPPIEYKPDPPKEPEKNISTSQKTTMDSTPISEIMGQPQDVPMMQEQMPPPMQAQVAQVQQQPPAAAAPMKSKNMFNLTDEQMEALTAAVVALIAFAGPVQEKLAGVVPNFSSEGGARSMTGMLVTGVLVAILFFFSRRFMNKA
jgi:hypothetical protein